MCLGEYSLQVPVASATGDDWIESSITKLTLGKGQKVVLPEYGQPAHVTRRSPWRSILRTNVVQNMLHNSIF